MVCEATICASSYGVCNLTKTIKFQHFAVVLNFADDISITGGLQSAVCEQRVIHRNYVCGLLDSSNKYIKVFSIRMKDNSLSVMVNISRVGEFGRQYWTFKRNLWILHREILYVGTFTAGDVGEWEKYGVMGSTTLLVLSVLSFNNYYYAYISVMI